MAGLFCALLLRCLFEFPSIVYSNACEGALVKRISVQKMHQPNRRVTPLALLRKHRYQYQSYPYI